jgi:hypothetical protein
MHSCDSIEMIGAGAGADQTARDATASLTTSLGTVNTLLTLKLRCALLSLEKNLHEHFERLYAQA